MVRYAKRDELERVNELRRQINVLHCGGRPDIFKPGFGESLENRVYDLYESDRSDVIVAERNGLICGYAMVNYVVKPESPYTYERKYYHVEEFCVDAAFRRMGVATDLVAFMRQQAKEKEIDRIELDVWEFNESAIEFYESVGFSAYRRYMELKP